MPFNGSGTFVSLGLPDFPAVSGELILASQYNNSMNDIFNNGLTKCVTRDGQSAPTADLPMAGFRHTGVGNAVADTDYAAFGQAMVLRGTVGAVDWDTRTSTGMYDVTAAALAGPASNFPSTSEVGQLLVINQGANIIHHYIVSNRSFSRRRVSGTWTAWVTFDSGLAATSNGVLVKTGANTYAARTFSGSAGLSISNPDGVAGAPAFNLDADLGAIAALTGTGFSARTGTDTWALRSLTQPAAGLTIANGDGVAGNPTFALANDLAAVEGLAVTGLVARTATDTWTARSLVQPAAGITITNSDGIAGNPTFALANDLSALEGLGSTGFAARTAADTWAVRTITGTANKITVTNGDGVAGNPTLTIPDVVTFVTPTITGLVTLNGGQIQFPATQVASAGANTLDDYEEGTFTPTLTFATPGDLSVVYATRTGAYVKIGQMVQFRFIIVTSTFAHSTASGALSITGLPFTLEAATGTPPGYMENFTPGANTQIGALSNGTQTDLYFWNVSTGATTTIQPGQAASGTNKHIYIGNCYRTIA